MRQKLLLFALLVCIFNGANILAQASFENLSLVNPKEEVLYFWWENELKINDPRVTMIRLDSNDGLKEFKLNFKKHGVISVFPYSQSVFTKPLDSVLVKFYSGNQMLYQKNIGLAFVDDPRAYLGYLDSFFIPKDTLIQSNELKIKLYPCAHKMACVNAAKIDSFHVEIRNAQGKIQYEEAIIGNRLSAAVMSELKRTEVGDYILCTKIRGTNLSAQSMKNQKLEYTLPNGKPIQVGIPHEIYFKDISVFLK